MVTADELLGAPLSVVVCEPFQPGCILVPLATWFQRHQNVPDRYLPAAEKAQTRGGALSMRKASR